MNDTSIMTATSTATTDRTAPKMLALAATVVAAALALDTVGMAVALPDAWIRPGGGTSSQWSSSQLALSGYLLALAIMLLVLAPHRARMGRVTWLVSLALWGGAGLAAAVVGGDDLAARGAANSAGAADVVAAFRAVQGAAMGALLSHLWPSAQPPIPPGSPGQGTSSRERDWSGPAPAIALAVAPAVGGAVTGWLSWRFVAGIDGAVALALIVLTWSLPARGPGSVRWSRTRGAAVGFTSLTLAAAVAARLGWDAPVLQAGALAALALTAVVVRRSAPAVTGRDVAHCAVACLLVAAAAVSIWVASWYLQAVEGFSPEDAGIVMVLFTAGAVLSALITRALSQPPHVVVTLAPLAPAVCIWWMAAAMGQWSTFLLALTVCGVTIGWAWAAPGRLPVSTGLAAMVAATAGACLVLAGGFAAQGPRMRIERVGELGAVLVGMGVMLAAAVALSAVLNRRRSSDDLDDRPDADHAEPPAEGESHAGAEL